MSLRAKLTFLGVLAFALDSCALGQSQTTGRIAGTIQDAQGRGIPKAEIVALATSTGETQRATANESGDYVLLSLTPGAYEINISAPGFANAIFHGIVAEAGNSLTVNAALPIAQGKTEILVNAAPPLLHADSAVIETTLNGANVEAVPLASRNPLQSLALSPGVSTALTTNTSLGKNSPQVSVNGARVNQNSYQVNGVDSNNISMHDLGDVGAPAPESVGEIVMRTSMYDASVPGAGGESIGLITKSGGNSIHGGVYEYLSNDALDANDPNLKAAGFARPALKRNVYGATLGGPFKKDRTFYFGSYQGTRETNGATSQSVYSNVLIDPCLTNDRSAATLMKNCSVPTVDPTALKLLNVKLPNGQYLIPTPQQDGLVTGNVNSTFHEEQFNANIDLRLSGRDLLTAKVFFADAPLFSALGWSAFGASPSFPGFGNHITVNNRILAIQENHSFRSAVNELRFGYNSISRNEQPDEAVQDAAVGISRITADQFPGLPLIFLARDVGSAAIGTNEITLRNASPSLSVVDFVSVQRGVHYLRFGGELRHADWRVDTANVLSYGEIDFATFQDFLRGNSELSLLGTGNTQVNFSSTDYHFFVQDDWKVSPHLTLNLGLRYELDLPPFESNGRIGGFDPSLYQPTKQVDPDGFPVGPPAEGIVMAGNASSAIHLTGVTRVGKRIFKSVDPRDIAPRIGMAWSPLNSGHLVLRGGYGVFYSRPSFLYLGLNFAEPPFYQVSTYFGEPLTDPFPKASPSSNFPLIPPGVLLGSPFAFVDRNNLNPYFQQFNAGVEYQISRDLALQIAYVGSRGLRLYRQVNVNQAAIASLDHPVTNAVTGEAIYVNTVENSPLRAPLQGVDPGIFFLNTSSGQSTYHSLQATVNHRFSHGVQFAASYTFSKSIDNTSDAGGGAFSDGSLDTGNGLDSAAVYGNQLDPRTNRGLSDFDRTHRFVISGLWDLPVPPVLKASDKKRMFFLDWQVAGSVIAMSGLPLDIFDPAGGSLYGQIYGARPNWAPGANLKTAKTNIPRGYYFNPYAFAQAVVQPGQPIPSAKDPTAFAGDVGTDYGDIGRNILRGPSQVNADLSVRKRFLLRESRNLELRADFFNVFNHANKSNPVSDISSAALDSETGQVLNPETFGRIISTDSSPRIVQLSLKLIF